jgi:hypothetical protein
LSASSASSAVTGSRPHAAVRRAMTPSPLRARRGTSPGRAAANGVGRLPNGLVDHALHGEKVPLTGIVRVMSAV